MQGPRTTRAFDGRADAYARSRLDYAPQAIEAACALAGLDATSAIADLGAGTGNLTRHFAERVARAYAVEPNVDMRARAHAELGHLTSVRLIEGTAHATTLADQSVDAVTAGRAIQWFEHEASQAEIRRILRPGGWLIVFRTPVMGGSWDAVLAHLHEVCMSRGATSRRHERAEADALGYFGGDNCIQLAYPCSVLETWPQFLDRLLSMSFAPRPDDPEYDQFVRRARAVFNQQADGETLRVDYETRVLMKRLSPPATVRASMPFPECDIESDIATRFERIADRMPDAVAIKHGEDTITYAELDARANTLAELILDASPDRSRPVALLFDHGLAGIASLLGVLKAGRAYCALFPANPIERHRETLSDLQPTLLLHDTEHHGSAQALQDTGVRCNVIDLQHVDATTRRPWIDRAPDDLAAIYYTSGTTGAPKGIAHNHRHFLHRVWFSAGMFDVAPGDRLSQIPGIGFVTAACDIFIALLNGATVCPFDARSHSLARITTWLNEERIAVVRMPVALFYRFLEALRESDRFPHVRFVHPAGRLNWEAVEHCRRHFSSDCRLVLQIASTETSVLASQLVDDATRRSGDSVPVGYPVPGKELWLENEAGMRCGPGEIGEIVVRSRYLFKGVWRRPATWCGPGEARLHRTGDLARWLADGSLEFVGRRDSRVKVRGFTVDLEHVEAGIEATGLVDEVAVVAHEAPGGDATLAAYFVPRHGTSAKLLRARLAEALPDFMLPAQFVPLDAFPLTPTGKLHRAALPKLNVAASSAAGGLPRSTLEAQIAAVWRETLGRSAIGIEEHFLEIGGDSLTAARIASRILATLGVELTPRDLFVAPTIAQMAGLVAARQAHGELATRPEVAPRAGPPIVP